MKIEIGKTYVCKTYDELKQFEFTPLRSADITYERVEEYGFAEGGVFTSGFYCDKLVETVHLWLNKETNTCIMLVDRKDYHVNIGFFGNSWKLIRDYVKGPNKCPIKYVPPTIKNEDEIFLSYFCFRDDSILNNTWIPMKTKIEILKFIGEYVEPEKVVYEV